jgi:excisionase family DNA binding protein
VSAPLLTPDDLAELFGLSPKKVLELRSKHGWPHVRLGRRIRFTEEQVAQIIAVQSPRSEAPLKSASGLTAGSARRRRSA